ncbi:hypothetical protein D3C86_1924110 [compost metagenome]
MSMVRIDPGIDQPVQIKVKQLRRMSLNHKTGITAADMLQNTVAFPVRVTDDIDIIHHFAQADHPLCLHQLVDIRDFNRTACGFKRSCRY